MKSDISGFPEFLPNEQIAFNRVISKIRERFESYGFAPMDTAAVERVSTLLAKGNDNEIYGLYRLADENSKKDLGLRFDLTVPLARYVSSNFSQLIFPFRRYQIAPVWRGERPQNGRYRQFYQCDVDILGDGSLALEHDAEIVALINLVLSSLNIPRFHTKLNNRKILSGFLKSIVDEGKIEHFVRLIDKVDKIPYEEFEKEAKSYLVVKQDFKKLAVFMDAEKKGSNFEILKWLGTLRFSDEFSQGVEELMNVVSTLKKLGIEDDQVKVCTKLARGLNYYTGLVFETVFDGELSSIGSISGGGRYDNLTTLISDKVLPGVGATIGVSRLVPVLMERGILKTDSCSPAMLLVTVQNRQFITTYMKIADRFRKIGVKTEVYLQDKSLGVQLNYANKKGYHFVVIANELELAESKAILRNLETREQKIIHTDYIGEELLKYFREW